MDDIEVILGTLAISLLFLLLSWIITYGFVRGPLAWVARLVWLAPLFLAFFPKSKTSYIPSSVSLNTIHVLVDDSDSMKANGWLAEAESIYKEISKKCVKLSCKLDKTYLSDLDSQTSFGITPLSKNLEKWIYGIGDDSWIIMTDGGDYKPTNPWSSVLSGTGILSETSTKRGLILAFHDRKEQNLWIDTRQKSILSFDSKASQIDVIVNRQIIENELPFQVQAVSGQTHLASVNEVFKAGDKSINLEIPIPPMGRGQHLIKVKILPIAGEYATWDNEDVLHLDVLPNTVGMLHLLGSPSWDGRFVRRFLKSEPKFDLISFFILRDPSDLQLTNERELSLIPFPVDRLFNQELNNFRSVIIQNFSLFQFLEPSYQQNLVNFVKDGGGLLFIGGPRSLLTRDVVDSPLAEILPFQANARGNTSSQAPFLLDVTQQVDTTGPYYDPVKKFKIELANPNEKQKDLATVFDSWASLTHGFDKEGWFRGIHHMENVKFKSEDYTPLLNAKFVDGNSMPLAVASYPGKGRAIWIFSDQLWKMAINPSPESSRELYNEFLSASFTWLLRQEIRQPLFISQFLLKEAEEGTKFEISINGPAADFLSSGVDWQFVVCGMDVDASSLNLDRRTSNHWSVSGLISHKIASGQECRTSISGIHPAFGSVEARMSTVMPQTYLDRDVGGAIVKAFELQELTGASLILAADDASASQIGQWLEAIGGDAGSLGTVDAKTTKDHYWFFDYWWITLLFLGLPLEVIIRRWRDLSFANFS